MSNYETISFDKRKENIREAFKEKFPEVNIISNASAEKIEKKYSNLISFRKGEEIVFKTKANVSKYDFSFEDAKKFAKDNKLKHHYIQSSPITERDAFNHSVFTAIRPKTKVEKINEREEKINQLQKEIQNLK